MRRWLGVVVSVVVRLAVAVAEDGACVEYIPLHKVFTHPTNTMAFSHGRVIRGDRYSIGGWCVQFLRLLGNWMSLCIGFCAVTFLQSDAFLTRRRLSILWVVFMRD
jgi:hypothetical protein